MEAADTKGKLLDHGFQQRLQPGFTDRGCGADHLPLGDFIHGIDVVDALDAIAIPLMHRIHSQKAGLALRVGPAPLADRHRRGPGLGEMQPAQAIDLGHRDPRQPLVFALLVLLVFPLEDLARGRAAEGFVGLVRRRQQFDVGGRVLAGKAMPPVAGGLEFSALPVLLDQPRDLRPAQSGHLDQILPQQPFVGAVLAAVAVLAKRARHPRVDLGPPFAFESNLLAGVEKLLDLLQVQLAGVLHLDSQFPACPLPDPSGSSCVRNKLLVQTHLA